MWNKTISSHSTHKPLVEVVRQVCHGWKWNPGVLVQPSSRLIELNWLMNYCFFLSDVFFCNIQPQDSDPFFAGICALPPSELLRCVRRKAWKSSTTGNWTTNGSRQLSLVGWISALGGYNSIAPTCPSFWNSKFWYVPAHKYIPPSITPCAADFFRSSTCFLAQ